MIRRKGYSPNDQERRRLDLTSLENGQVRLDFIVPRNGKGKAIIVDSADLQDSAGQRDVTIEGHSPRGLDALLTIRITEHAGLYARNVEQDDEGNWHEQDGGYAIHLSI